MALLREWYLEIRSQDETLAVFDDYTIYGAPELNRNQEAHFIVIAKMDEFEKLVFITGVDNTDPLNTLKYPFTNSADGAYRLIEFIPTIWTGSLDFVIGNICYHSSDGHFYKCIQNNGVSSSVVQPGITGGWAAYWTIDPDFTLEVENSLVDKFIHDDVITFRYEDCLVKELDEVADDVLCGVCNKWEDLYKPMQMQLMLAATNSTNWQDKQTRSEVIITESQKRFCC